MRLGSSFLAVVFVCCLPACSLSRDAIGAQPGHDASVDASTDASDAGRDGGHDAGHDADLPDTNLPDLGLPDMGVDAFVTPPDMGVDAFVAPDAGHDGGNDGGSDAGPCALCTGAQMCCTLTCVDTTNDVTHCGGCAACDPVPNGGPTCITSGCRIAACTSGFADCNATYADGCEIHTDADVANCGACGHACRVGQMCSAGACHGWGVLTTTGAPPARSQHTAVWTGTRMIVWGGNDGMNEVNTGGVFDPATNTWTATSLTGAPGARRGHAAVWTGSRMLVWSGYRAGTGWLTDGGLYDPTTDTWAPLPGTSPAGRSRFPYAYDDTDHRMFVFGGWDATSVRGDGALFDGTTWSTTSTTGDPSARRYLPMVWTGSRFLVWGGENATNGGDLASGVPSNVLQDGARFDPIGNAWSAITNSGRPAGRSRHLEVWTGTQMVVWGGWDQNQNRLATGGRYTPSSDSWQSVAATTIRGRVNASAVYSGRVMIVWGGTDVHGAPLTVTDYLADGAAYSPTDDSWIVLPTMGAPSGRADHTAIWDGTEMIGWGGANQTTTFADGAIFAL